MTFWIGCALVLLAIAFALWPLFVTPSPGRDEPGDEARLRRATLYREILDAEIDHRLGKLADDDYVEFREQLLREAASLIATNEITDATPVRQLIEAEIAAARGRLHGAPRTEGAGA